MPERKTGIEGHVVLRGGAELRMGYTTGTCAAAAAKAACRALFGGDTSLVRIMTPKGIALDLEPRDVSVGDGWASCAIRKFSGDDPDVTNGVLVYAEVRPRGDAAITVDGGIGVGRVTKPGLWQAIGEAAINRVPREMIAREVREALDEAGRAHGADVVISIPAGVELAKKTFNPRLGIVGGISVLGTSGIVEPMSETALIESIRLELRQKRAGGAVRLIMSPGNYGADFMRGLIGAGDEDIVKCSNYLGEALDMAVAEGWRELLFVSHIGKAIKVAGAIMNTHSRTADARAEMMTACAIRAGADLPTARAVLDCLTTDEMLDVLDGAGMLAATMDEVATRALACVARRAGDGIEVGVVIFSNARGLLATSGRATEWLDDMEDRG